MAVGSAIKTWQFDTNNDHDHNSDVDTNVRQILLIIKDIMVGFTTSAWAVQYSCDASVAGVAGDGVDRWSTVADVTPGNPGNAHSWIVLSQTGLNGMEVCFDYEVGASVEKITIAISFTGGFTGGTTTNRPTATDEFEWLNQADFFDGLGDVPAPVHGMMSTDGEVTRIIITEGNSIDHYLTFEKLKDSVDNWSTPYVFFYATDLSNFTRTFGTTSTEGGTSSFGGNIVPLQKMSTEFFRDAPAGETQGTTSVSSQSDFSGEFNMYPVGYYVNTPPYRGRHGEFFDLFMVPDAMGSGEMLPSTGTTVWIAFGILLFPWDGTVGRLG